MSVLNRIAFCQNRRDEAPNQELARRLAQTCNADGVREIADNLWNKNQKVRSDCLKVLYEIGYLQPDLIAGYADDFLKLLVDKNNRMVWGGMIALSTIADLNPRPIWEKIDDVLRVVGQGTVITQVAGIRTVSRVASTDDARRRKLLPWLMNYLKTCAVRDVPIHAESIHYALGEGDENAFLALLEDRKAEMKPSQVVRLKKVIKKFETEN